MHLQIQLEPATEIADVGILAAIGTVDVPFASGTPTVAFLLAYSIDAPLAKYFNPINGFVPGSFLYNLFVKGRVEMIKSATDENQRYLFFTVEMAGELRDARKFFHAIGAKIHRDLCVLEDRDVTVLEMEDELKWTRVHHGNRRMPLFERPRHGGETENAVTA